MEMDIIDEQLDTLGRAFMGMTLGCARCHDHKFDPIPTSDYYALAGILKSTHTMDNHKVVAQWHEIEVGTASFAQNRPRSTRQLANKKRSTSSKTPAPQIMRHATGTKTRRGLPDSGAHPDP